ncbi:MAG TPA: hypothetical protein VLY87_05970 [Flavobacterium sp.]|nr:hypothetical protein [Flavobacterium sp.]
MDCIQSLKDTPAYPQIHAWVFDMRTGKIIDLDLDAKADDTLAQPNPSFFIKLKSLFKK